MDKSSPSHQPSTEEPEGFPVVLTILLAVIAFGVLVMILKATDIL